MARSVLSNAFATEKNGVFAIVAVAPWGGSGGGTLPPPKLARCTGLGMVPPAPFPPSAARLESIAWDGAPTPFEDTPFVSHAQAVPPSGASEGPQAAIRATGRVGVT